jgi:Spy/CpxP family protein refolding chaperone
MTSRRLLFVGCFVAAFLAGFALHAAVGRRGHREGGPRFEEELNLTPEQSQKMRDIWSAVRDKSRELGDAGFEAVRTERDKGIRELLSSESIVKYDEILAGEAAAREAFEAGRKEIFDKAVEETRKLLDDRQRARYDELMAERRNRRDDRERGPDTTS